MLNSFFKINMPYCLQRREDGSYICLNREYRPIGVCDPFCGDLGDPFLGIHFRVKITPKFAASVSVEKSEDVNRIFLYRDNNEDHPPLPDYFRRLHRLFDRSIKMTENGYPYRTKTAALHLVR